MSAGRKRALLVAGVVVLVAVLVVATLSGISEQQRLDRAHDNDAAQHTLIQSTREATAGQRAAIESAYLAAVKLTTSIAVHNVDISATFVELSAAKGALANAEAILVASTGRRDFVQQCLVGVRQALDATAEPEHRRSDALPAERRRRVRSRAHPCRARSAPALAFDFPDPYVLRTGFGYIAYATNAAGGAVQKARSADLTRWELAGDALTALPAWAVPGATWAPAAIQRGNETLLYYTVRQKSPDRLCISVAASASPEGPFIDSTTGPLECSDTSAIDPSPFVAPDGTLYLLFKAERPSRIYGAPDAARRPQLHGTGAAHAHADPGLGGRRASRRPRCCGTARATGSSTRATTGTRSPTRRGSPGVTGRSGRVTRSARTPCWRRTDGW